MYTEWELMAISEDIEPGDTVAVENEDGEEELLMFVKQKNNNIVLFKNAEGEIRQFSAHSLEEIKGNAAIAGKSEKEVSIHDS